MPFLKLVTVLGASLVAAAPAHSVQSAERAIPAFDHVAINVADQQNSVDFYAGAFGMKEIPAPFAPGGPRWMELAGGIALHIQSLAEKPAPPPRAVHFAIAVADFAPVFAYLAAHRMRWTDSQGRIGKVQDIRTDGVRQIYVQDPDGYWIEVNDKLKDR